MTQAPTRRPLIIGVAGGTGSGKTTVAGRLASALPGDKVVSIEHDSYYRQRGDLSPEARKEINYDHPDSLETELLVQHVRALRQGQSVDVPIYDFVTHLRAANTTRVTPAPVVIVEGILTLADEALRSLCDIKIFVDTDADIRVFRRIRRDLEQRGRSFQSVRERYYKFVRPMHLEFVEPSKRWADLILPEGGNNRVALEIIMAKLEKVADEHGLDIGTWGP